MQREVLHLFLLRSRHLAHSPNTIRTYKERLEPFLWWLDSENLTLDTVGKEHLQAYLARGTVCDETRNGWLRVFRTFFAFLHSESIITHNPARGILVRRVPQKVRQIPSPQELDKLLRSFPDGKSPFCTRRNVLITTLLLDTGVRVSEGLGLRMEDIDLAERRVHISHETAKGRKARVVPMSYDVARMLTVYIVKDRPKWVFARGIDVPQLFVGEEGALTVRAYRQALRRASERSGVKISPHGLRHAHATLWLEEGGDLATLQAQLGHSNIATTSLYLHPSFANMRQKNDEFSPLAQMRRAKLPPMKRRKKPS
jgi:integrase/recombinase XerD